MVATVPAWFWVIAAGVIALLILSSIGGRLSRRRKRTNPEKALAREHSGPTVNHEIPTDNCNEWDDSEAERLGDPLAQLQFISRVELARKRLLQPGEYKVFRLLEEVADEMQAGHRVMAQTSMGEIIETRKISGTKEERDLAFRSYNSKCLDYLVIDRAGWPVLGVEYQGGGHLPPPPAKMQIPCEMLLSGKLLQGPESVFSKSSQNTTKRS